MADNRKLTAGLLMMPESERQDLARMGEEYKRFQEADYLRKMGEQGVGLAKSVARGVPQMATGLVDLASLPFEAAGVLQPGQAVGSTKWLESKGYLPEQQEGFANQLTELLSGGFDPSDLVTKGLPALGMIGKTVWHGSPHSFEKFDLSKIGTGEGAQAYGHGLYLADAPEVAEAYRGGKEGMVDVFIGGKKFEPTTNAEKMALNAIRGESRSIGADPFVQAEKYFSENLPSVVDEVRPKYEEALQAVRNLKEQNPTLQGGSLYKVDLPDEQIAKMLDWDKPLVGQPQTIREFAWANQGPLKRYAEAQGEKGIFGLTGNDLYTQLLGEMDAQQVSKAMNEAGISGIQYLDQASRGAGEGTRNYVVFSDEIPQILERNNIPVNK